MISVEWLALTVPRARRVCRGLPASRARKAYLARRGSKGLPASRARPVRPDPRAPQVQKGQPDPRAKLAQPVPRAQKAQRDQRDPRAPQVPRAILGRKAIQAQTV